MFALCCESESAMFALGMNTCTAVKRTKGVMGAVEFIGLQIKDTQNYKQIIKINYIIN